MARLNESRSPEAGFHPVQPSDRSTQHAGYCSEAAHRVFRHPRHAQTKGTILTARRKIRASRNDRDAADYGATHDSVGYAQTLPAAALKVSPARRQRVAGAPKRPVTLRLEQRQIAAARRAAARMTPQYQTLF
jgi:hypothetical protein